ncbi:MAG: hypothetical protein JSV11_00020, partial [Nitrospiraceae bacterium]
RAAMSGLCYTCHTMHNSQNGSPVVSLTYGTETTDAKAFLLVGSCMGCHAQGTANNIETLGTSDIPQVYHTDTTDLAAGNFRYILGGSSDNKGHNIVDFGEADSKIQPPGRRHDINGIANFTCAGTMGCHGIRGSSLGGIEGMSGAHHNNAGPELSTADTVANSYRFLSAVKGYENNGANIWENLNSTNHNEYFGATTPMSFTGCTSQSCHDASDNARPQNNTMSGFCATCHGYFHLLDSGGREGVGDDINSPFIRHPTDVILPTGTPDTEYETYTTYNVVAPVARTSVPSSMSATVTPGTDVVMCLSCHGAHATNYDDMLRWDYKSTTLATAIAGCGVCHTDKN